MSFGDGHGVWEKDGGPLPFYGRNFLSARQWAQPLDARTADADHRSLQNDAVSTAPAGAGTSRQLGVTRRSHAVARAESRERARIVGTGLVWAAIQPAHSDSSARRPINDIDSRPIATVVQVTNLGITVKDSPQNTLVFVTRLDNGAPVAARTCRSSASTTASRGRDEPTPRASRWLRR